ncbi:unnamed protein product [Peronospora belbahrii]|uniref:HIT domain-containing protein n=1 Tax=Peronospora belbahrii TaxID=622444 RepID=A0AAU9KQ83_9STRA|nr:unnamed protein product [Peronospora belbahrii]
MITVMSISSTPSDAQCRTTSKKTQLHKRLRACLPHFHTTETETSGHEVQEMEFAVKTPSSPASMSTPSRRLDIDSTNRSWSVKEDVPFFSIKASQCQRKRRQHSSSPCASLYSASSSSSTSSTFSVAKKGVTYGQNGTLMSCRFCNILESGDEVFLYEDEDVVVFRPLAPVVSSHILVVPRRHIRNVNKLTLEDTTLLHRMREVATMVLREMPRPSVMPDLLKAERVDDAAEDCTDEEGAESDYKFAFHSPPFNSIDHVHMHAFRTRDGRFGCVGSIKYRTETWWCRSFDEVMTRLGLRNCKQRNNEERVESITQKKEHRRRHHVSHPLRDSTNESMILTAVESLG